MSVIATYYGVIEILDAFEAQAKKPYFSMWVNKAPALQNHENDFETAKAVLKRKIEDFARANQTHVFTIHLHNTQPDRKTGAYAHADNCYTMLYCQAKHAAPVQSNTSADISHVYTLIEKQNEILNALTSKVNANEAEETETIGSAPVMPEWVAIALQHPAVNTILSGVADWTTEKLFKAKAAKITSLAGTQDTTLEQTIDILYSKGVTLEHLQKLASYPEAKIKMLLTML